MVLIAVIIVEPAIIYSFVKEVCERGETVNTSVKTMQNDPFVSLVCQSTENWNKSYGMCIENICMNHLIHHSAKEPEAPFDFKVTNSGSTQVTLEWKEPKVTTEEGLSYTVSLIEGFFFLWVDKS